MRDNTQSVGAKNNHVQRSPVCTWEVQHPVSPVDPYDEFGTGIPGVEGLPNPNFRAGIGGFIGLHYFSAIFGGHFSQLFALEKVCYRNTPQWDEK